MPLPTGMFNSLRQVVADTSPDIAQIQRRVSVADGEGGATEDWPTIATVACKVATLGSNRPEERVYADRLQNTVGMEITVPTGTDVTGADRIVVGAVTYEVLGVAPSRSFEVRRRVVCVAVTP